MNYWKSKRWMKLDSKTLFSKKGLYLRIEQDVDREVRRACVEFARWLRSEYEFPIRVIVYVKASNRISSMNGELVYGTCWRPNDKIYPPYIKISTGDYKEMLDESGKDNALSAILHCMAAMLTHYYQWLNDIDNLSELEEERQADKCAMDIIRRYAQTREHP